MKILLPDGTQSLLPSKTHLKPQLLEEEKRYADFLKLALQTCRLDGDSCRYMLNFLPESPEVEIVIPCLPSSSDGLNSDSTKRFLLCTACQSYASKGLGFLEPKLAEHVQLINDFILSNKHGIPLSDLQQNSVNAILSSEAMTTQLLDKLLPSSALRYQWMRVKGKSGRPYKLRICDTDLAICEDIGDAVPIRIWSWTELEPAKATKAEIRIPWILSSTTDDLPSALNDVLASLTPVPVKCSASGDAPIRGTFQFTICLSTVDAATGIRLARQLACARGMGLRTASPPSQRRVAAEEMASPARKSKRRWWLCGLGLCRKSRENETRPSNAVCQPPAAPAVTSAPSPPPAKSPEPITLQAEVAPPPPSPPQPMVPPKPQQTYLPLYAANTFALSPHQTASTSPAATATVVTGAAGEAEAELDKKTVQDLEMDAANMCSGRAEPVVGLSPQVSKTSAVNVPVQPTTPKGYSTPLREYNLQAQPTSPSLSPPTHEPKQSKGPSGATDSFMPPEPPTFEPATSSIVSFRPSDNTGFTSKEPVHDRMPEPPSRIASLPLTGEAEATAASKEVNVLESVRPVVSETPKFFGDSPEKIPVGSEKLPPSPATPSEDQPESSPSQTIPTPAAPRSPGKISAIPLPRNPTRAMSVPIGEIPMKSASSTTALPQPSEEKVAESPAHNHSTNPAAVVTQTSGQPQPQPSPDDAQTEKRQLPSAGGSVRTPQPPAAVSSSTSSLETSSETTGGTTKRYASLGYTPRSPEHPPPPSPKPPLTATEPATTTTKRYASLGYSRSSEPAGASPSPQPVRMASLGYTPRSADPSAAALNGVSPKQPTLIEPKVVVKQPKKTYAAAAKSSKPAGGSKVAANAPPSHSCIDSADYDGSVNSPANTGSSQVPAARPVVSGIRPPAVFTDASLPRYKAPTSRSGPPPSDTSSPSNGISRSDPPPTGIRMPSRLPRQAIAK